MRDIWTANLVAKLHLYDITYEELGEKLGFRKNYVGMILNGVRKPAGAQEKFEAAVEELIREKIKEEK